MTQYLIVGRPPQPASPPFTAIDAVFDGVGKQVDLTLTADDEQTLIAAGVLEKIVWVLPASRILA